MSDIPTMKSEVCSAKNQISLIVHNGPVKSDYNSGYSMSCKEKITLFQEPEESAILEFCFSYSKYSNNYYNTYYKGMYNFNYNFILTFENNLHEVSKDYGYEIDFYLYAHENELSTHSLLFSKKIIRKSNKIEISYASSMSNNNFFSPEIIDKLLINTDKRHMCCSIRRYNIKIAEDKDKQSTQNLQFGVILFETGLYSDVSLVVGEKLFQVHKYVLSSVSDIFKAMFSHEMLENQNGIVIIEDFNPEIVEGLLSFIYTGKTSLLSKMPIELFQAAHKYEIQRLKTLCIENFRFILNCENVVDMLYTARMYELTDLETDLLKFIDIHEEEMVKENSFQRFLCHDLKIDNLVYTLKLCDKYKESLESVETEAFKFTQKNNKILTRNKEFLKLFESHSLLMKRSYAFIFNRKND